MTQSKDSNPCNNQKSGTPIALAIASTVVVGSIGLMLPFVSGLRHKLYLPYMATPKHKIRKALQDAVNIYSSTSSFSSSSLVQTNKNRPRNFIDLGSGDGEAVYQAVKLSSQVAALDQAVGIELNPTLYAIASLRRLTWTSYQRRHSIFLCDSFWNHPLQPYDIVMIFGVQPLMRDLCNKIHRECRPGTIVLSYRFPLPPGSSIDSHDQGTTVTSFLVKLEDEMFTYVLKKT